VTRLLIAGLVLAAAAAPAAAAPWSPDATFGINGFVGERQAYPGLAEDGGLQNIRALRDGRVVVVGVGRCGMDCNFVMTTRFTRDGVVDGTFDDIGDQQPAGTVTFPGERVTDPQLTNLAIGPDGHLVRAWVPDPDLALPGEPTTPQLYRVAGGGWRTATGLAFPFRVDREVAGAVQGFTGRRLIRLRADGTRDPGFEVELPALMEAPLAAPVVAGAVRLVGWGARGPVVATHSAAGARVRVASLAVRGWTVSGRVRQALVRRDGTMVLAADTGSLRAKPVLIGIGRDGRRDRTFGRAGVVRLPSRETVVAVDRQRRILVLQGVVPFAEPTRLRLTIRRLTPRGRPDRSFPPRELRAPGLRAIGGIGLDVDRSGRILVAASAVDPGFDAGLLYLARLKGGG
jgi:hypothetical protein